MNTSGDWSSTLQTRPRKLVWHAEPYDDPLRICLGQIEIIYRLTRGAGRCDDGEPSDPGHGVELHAGEVVWLRPG